MSATSMRRHFLRKLTTMEFCPIEFYGQVHCAPVMWSGGECLTKLYWDGQAAYYDNSVRPVDGFIDICEKRIISDLIRTYAKNHPILELGFGTGRHTLTLIDKGFKIVGIDIGKNLAKIARRKLRTRQNVELIIADAEKLPLKSKIFTAVVSIQTFDYIPNINRALREVRNTLKGNGQIVITLLNGLSLYYALTKRVSVLRLMRPSEIEVLLSKNGLRVINMRFYQILPIMDSFSVKLPKFFRRILALLDYMFGRMPLVKYYAMSIIIHASIKDE